MFILVLQNSILACICVAINAEMTACVIQQFNIKAVYFLISHILHRTLVNIPIHIRITLKCIIDYIIGKIHYVLGVTSGKLSIMMTVVIIIVIPP